MEQAFVIPILDFQEIEYIPQVFFLLLFFARMDQRCISEYVGM